MSFRLRLTLFFVLIVVLPMIALAILVSQIAADSADGKSDARLDSGLRTATNLFESAERQSQRSADAIAAQIADDPDLAARLEAGGRSAVRGLAAGLARSADASVLILSSAGGGRASIGGEPVAGASVDLVDPAGRRIGSVTVSVPSSSELINRITRTTGEEAALVGPSGALAGTVPIEAATLPESGDAAEIERADRELRVAATAPLGLERVRIALFAPAQAAGFFASRPRVAVAVAVFFVVALIAVLLILRSLQAYVRDMLDAAKRVGGGDFSAEVPVSGDDELAGLATEFNRMSDRLGVQMDQLRRQRLEIESSVRRIGDAFASGLDRDAMLEILVETAVGSCEADYGLVALRGRAGARSETGEAGPGVREAALAAERQALAEGGPIEIELAGAYALAGSMGRIGRASSALGAMTVARGGRPFTAAERDVFLYLLTQASASVENVALHELVSEQAVTDDLTGLANKRAFRETIEREAARAGRFGHSLSLLLVDLDDFKRVNDTYGHPQGDEVLREVGRVLTRESREIDEPARYGGEEFAVALPETEAEGALEVAERIRAAVAALRIERVDGAREPLRVTASLGLATRSGASAEVEDLIAAADDALYEAKRAGKDRVGFAGGADLARAGFRP